MIHDPELLDRLAELPQEPFVGEVFRATRKNLDPLAGSYSGGRWMPRDEASVLYTSLAREGALAELSFHLSLLYPLPTKPIILHTIRATTHRTLRLVRADLATLGVPEGSFDRVKLPRTQEVGAAVEFLGCDGLIAPSARWPCDNLILFPERFSSDASVELVDCEIIEWLDWARNNTAFLEQ